MVDNSEIKLSFSTKKWRFCEDNIITSLQNALRFVVKTLNPWPKTLKPSLSSPLRTRPNVLPTHRYKNVLIKIGVRKHAHSCSLVSLCESCLHYPLSLAILLDESSVMATGKQRRVYPVLLPPGHSNIPYVHQWAWRRGEQRDVTERKMSRGIYCAGLFYCGALMGGRRWDFPPVRPPMQKQSTKLSAPHPLPQLERLKGTNNSYLQDRKRETRERHKFCVGSRLLLRKKRFYPCLLWILNIKTGLKQQDENCILRILLC